jgi:hypothetical protein
MADCDRLWERFVELANEIENTRVNLLNHCSEHISPLMHDAFHDPAKRGAAFELIHWMSPAMRAEFLPQLVESASYANKYTANARQTILALPRRWTIDNIRTAYEPILQRDSAHEEEFGLLLSLVKELDESLADNIAKRAEQHRNPSVQEIGSEYLRGRRAQPPLG